MIIEGCLIASFLASIAVSIIARLAVSGIRYLFEQWGNRNTQTPESVKSEMTETDESKMDDTKNLIHEKFGDDVVKTFGEMSNMERVTAIDDFAEALKELYGLDDISVDITVDELQTCGYYNWKDKKAVFNISLLMCDKNHEKFSYCVREVLDTIVHELRHAVQHRAMNDPDFREKWGIEESRAKKWEENKDNYISPGVDLRRYSSQPMEADAFTFAGQVMEDVFNKKGE